jgi:SAM-dependent methyltransferase
MSQFKGIAGRLKRYPILYNFVRHQLYSRLRSFNRHKVFADVYKNNSWDETSTVSGIGSSLKATDDLRAALPGVFEKLQVKSLLDIPCGDFHWMQHVLSNIDRYIGADIVSGIVAENNRAYSDRGVFIRLDIVKDRLPKVDAILCRDCLVHLSLREVRKALRNVRRAAPKYLMLTTFPGCSENIDTVSPYWRALNFETAPFNFPKPLFLLKDYSVSQKNDQGKYLGVWRAVDIRV